MSKRSLFWGNASGKLGETVLYRAGGEQRARAYVAKIKNPKTLAQMVNRVSMANFASFYRNAKPFLSQSFTYRKGSQSGFNALMHANKSSVSPAIGIADAQAGYSVPYGFIVSEGNVPFMDNSLLTVTDLNALSTGFVGSALPPQSISVSPSLDDLKQAIFDSLRGNSELAAVLPNVFKINVIISEYADDGFRTYLRAIAVDKSAITDFSSDSSTMLKISGNLSATPYGVLPFSAVVDAAGAASLVVAAQSDSTAGNGGYFAAYFVSYTDGNGKIQVSSARMTYIGDVSYYSQYLPGGDVYEQVLSSLGVNADGVLSTAAQTVNDSTSGIGNIPVVTSVTVGGQSLGSTLNKTGVATISVQGRQFDEMAPTLTVDGSNVALSVVSNTLASADFDFTTEKTYELVATLGASSVSGAITVKVEDDNYPV